jgi:hypothetical protein
MHDRIKDEKERKMVSKKEYIEKAAYFIWLNRGCNNGQDRDNWDEACRIYELTHIEAPIALSAPKVKPGVAIKHAPRKAIAKKAKAGKALFGRVAAVEKPAAKGVQSGTAEKPVAVAKAKKRKAGKAVAPVAKKAVAKPARKVSRMKLTPKPKVAKVPEAKKLAKEPAVQAQPRQSAKIIPMPKDVAKPAAALPKTKIKIIVGTKR